MLSNGQLAVGHIPYLNCIPFFHYLRDYGFAGRLVSGVPSELNRMLQQGELDVSPSSSFEYARNWKNYLLLPGHSISSAGPVESVLLFSPVAPEKLSGYTISVTGDSATSVNLLRILLREFVGLEEVRDEIPQQAVESMIAAGHPALLIGDRALTAAGRLPRGMFCFDLGQLWYQYTGLPFVFALWMARREAVAVHADALTLLGRQLSDSRQRFFAGLETLAEDLGGDSCLTAQQKIDYWNNIDYGLSDKHIRGLRLFFDLCLKYRLVNERPRIEFLQRG
jgi:chorismate dehydratase